MSNKRLFTVTYINEVVVLATNQQEAEKIAWSHREDGLELDSTAPMIAYPADWTGDSQPYGSDGPTLDELVAAGCAPEYTALRDGLLSKASAMDNRYGRRSHQADDEGES